MTKNINQDLYLDKAADKEVEITTCGQRSELRKIPGDENNTDEFETPLEGFFRNEFLTILYNTKAKHLSHHLSSLRKHLRCVVDESQERYDRATAAILIGDYIKEENASKEPKKAFHTSHSDACSSWYEYAATELASTEAALALAREQMYHRENIVIFNEPSMLVPRLFVANDQKKKNDTLNERITKIWLDAMMHTLHASSTDFELWRVTEKIAAVVCIVNFLCFSEDKNSPCLHWIIPIWDKLIDSIEIDGEELDSNTFRTLKSQKLIITSMLENGKLPNNQVVSQRLSKKKLDSEFVQREWTALDIEQGRALVVIDGEIPPSVDREDKFVLARYDVLQAPVRLAEVPSLEILDRIFTKLCNEFTWAVDAVASTMEEMFARRLTGSVTLGMQPILLIGVPGTGKTRFAQRLSEELGIPNTVINMAGMTDTKILKGVSRGWASNRPSRIVELMMMSEIGNPLFILDEVDKARSWGGNGGDPHDALLDLLEPGNAKRYSDIYLMTECNVSHALYVLTSNSWRQLSLPLQSRVKPVLFPEPTAIHTPVIIDGVLDDLAKHWFIPREALELKPEQRKILTGLPPREIKRVIVKMLGRNEWNVSRVLH